MLTFFVDQRDFVDLPVKGIVDRVDLEKQKVNRESQQQKRCRNSGKKLVVDLVDLLPSRRKKEKE